LRLTRPVLALAAACIATAAIGAPAALAASQTCAVATSTPSFAAWGDQNLYTPFQGSTFEQGAQGWSWGGGANIVAGDDDHLLSLTGSHAVQIPGGGTAKSPHLCVDTTMPSMRFLIRRVSGTGNLTITGSMDGAGGFRTAVATVSATTTWAPTIPLVFPTTIVGANMQFLFTADPGTTYRIDDIQMDPYRRT
jgi:hypothetical protein